MLVDTVTRLGFGVNAIKTKFFLLTLLIFTRTRCRPDFISGLAGRTLTINVIENCMKKHARSERTQREERQSASRIGDVAILAVPCNVRIPPLKQ